MQTIANPKTTRVRGLAPWRPHRETLALLDQIRAVLGEYEVHLPLTIRQVFYRLVGAHGFEKSEREYSRLGEHLNRARRAGIIPWDALRDDGITWEEAGGWESAADLVRTFVHAAEHLTLDRQDGQSRRLFFAVEAAGMVPQIARIAAPFGIAVHSSGGFDSATGKYALASRLVPRIVRPRNKASSASDGRRSWSRRTAGPLRCSLR